MAKYRTEKSNNRPGLYFAPAAPGAFRPGKIRLPGVKVRRPPAVGPRLPPPPKPPGGPLFKPPRVPRVPFGKRLPPGIGRLPPSVLKRLFPWVTKAIPFVSIAFTAWEIYDWMKNPDIGPHSANLVPYGGMLCCKDAGVFPLNGYQATTTSSDLCPPPLCGLGGQVKQGDWPPRVISYKTAGTARYHLYLGKTSAPSRQIHGEEWHFPNSVAKKGINIPAAKPFVPEIPFIHWPDWLYPPVPFAPQPIPLAPPLNWPDPQPSPDEPPPPPAPLPPPPVVLPAPGGPPSVPAINWSPGGPADIGPHYKVPPDPERERERKKRFGPSASYKWFKFIEKLGGNYMEFDDNVSALYKGLHWSVRRWRGRDGVWRDRDITSTARLERLFQYAATVKFSVNDALLALAEEQATDWAFGKIGNAIKKKTAENADAGWWAGARGPSSQPQDNQWSEAYKKLQQERYKRDRIKRPYTSWRERQDGQWVRLIRFRPDTQIPWFKQKSNYPAPLRLRGNQLKGGFGRNYYAPNATQRPRTIKGLR